MTLRALAMAVLFAAPVMAEPPRPLQTFEDVRAEWVRVSKPLPQAPSKCHDLARWMCAAQAIAARSRNEEPDVRGCLTLIDESRELDRTPIKRKRCAAVFRGAVAQTRRFEVAMHEAGRANGATVSKPDARWQAVIRTVPFMALLAHGFEGAAI